jgi:hypothetical protein
MKLIKTIVIARYFKYCGVAHFTIRPWPLTSFCILSLEINTLSAPANTVTVHRLLVSIIYYSIYILSSQSILSYIGTLRL